MTYELNELEAKARGLFDARRQSPEFTPFENGVLVVFHAMWHASLSADRIDAIASAMQGMTGYSWRPEIDRLVKAKVLRSRRQQGITLYEVAL